MDGGMGRGMDGMEWKEAWNGWTDVMDEGVEWKEGWDKNKEKLSGRKDWIEGRMEVWGVKMDYRRE